MCCLTAVTMTRQGGRGSTGALAARIQGDTVAVATLVLIHAAFMLV